MDNQSVIGTLILLFTGLVTYKGLRDAAYFEDHLFETDAILKRREWKRLFSSGFLHVGWLHFGFNMIALMSFSWSLEAMFGYWEFAFIYFASLIGGSLLALYIHRNHGDYRAVGASGAVSGVIFASIFLFPEANIKLLFIPIGFPGWLLGILFIVVSIFGIKNKAGNIGHEAHLGGAIVGGVITLFLMKFQNVNWWVAGAMLVPAIAFLVLIVRNPAVLVVYNYWGEEAEKVKHFAKRKKTEMPEKKVMSRQEELDSLLDKIRESGFKSLTERERKRLGELREEL